MRYQIRKSHDGKFYYAIKIDAHNNEKLLGENPDLETLKTDLKLPSDTEVVNEEDTRGTIEDPNAHVGEEVSEESDSEEADKAA
jgi:hypothetical protein